MPAPEHLGPLGVHLVDATFTSCQGRVLFVGGSEVAVIDEPRLIEVVRSDDVPSLPHLLEAATTIALAPAEAHQVSGGGSNARFGSTFDKAPAAALPSPAVRSCAVVADRPEVAAAVNAGLKEWGVTCHSTEHPASLADLDGLDAVVVALSGRSPASDATSAWERILSEHDGIVDHIHADAQWARAVAELATSRDQPIRLVTITEATTAGGRSRAQGSAQLARAGRKATGDRVLSFAISAESEDIPAELASYLACSPDPGAELVWGAGWFGLRSHPRPIGSISFGGPSVPAWFDDTLREVVGPR